MVDTKAYTSVSEIECRSSVSDSNSTHSSSLERRSRLCRFIETLD